MLLNFSVDRIQQIPFHLFYKFSLQFTISIRNKLMCLQTTCQYTISLLRKIYKARWQEFMSLLKWNLVIGIMARLAFNHRPLKQHIFMLLFLLHHVLLPKKGKLNKYHVLRKYNTCRNAAIITNATVINITFRIKKIKDNPAQTIRQIPGRYLHLKILKRI